MPQGPVEEVIGRDVESELLIELVDSARLVTIHGPGGCGKTTLVRQLPMRHHFVPLAPADADDDLAAFVATAVGAPRGPTLAPAAAVAQQLDQTRALLVLDNCEHVLDAVASFVLELLARSEHLRIVTTSREVLNLSQEHVLTLSPLRAPAPGQSDLPTVAAAPAVQLFVAAARQRSSGFVLNDDNAATVATLCRRLDGVPLALELAAGWTRVLSPEAIVDQIERDLLSLEDPRRDVDERHRTLDACVRWSMRLLEPPELEMLERLSLFPAGCTLSTAEVLLGGDARRHLEALARKSLIVVDDAPRYRLLETVREVTRRSLEMSPDAQRAARRDFLRTMAEVAEQLGIALTTGSARHNIDQLHAEEPNLVAAVRTAAADGQAEPALRIVGALERYWWQRPASRMVTDLALAIDGDLPALRAEALLARALVAVTTFDFPTALADSEEAARLAGAAEDRPLEARARCWLGWTLAQIDPRRAHQEFRAALDLLDDSGPADVRLRADILCGLAALAASAGDPVRARAQLNAASQVPGATEAPLTSTYVGTWSALVHLQQGRCEMAVSEAAAAATSARRVGSGLYELFALTWHCQAAIGLGDLDSARRCLGQAEEVVTRGWEPLAFFREIQSGLVLLAEGDVGAAAAVLAQVAPAAAAVSPGLGGPLFSALADARTLAGDTSGAVEAVEAGFAAIAGMANAWASASLAAARSRASLRAGDPGTAYGQALEALEEAVTCDDVLTGSECLDVLAVASLAAGQQERGDRLAAAAARLRDEHRLARRWPLPEPAPVPDESAGAALGLAEALAYAARGRGVRGRPAYGWGSLTPTEREVVILVAEGLSNPEIAARLFVARSTVKDHLSKVFRKLGLTTRAELAAAAVRHGVAAGPASAERGG